MNDDVGVVPETQRLAAKYGFSPTSVYQFVLKGFAADFSAKVAAALRCEASVRSIEYNSVAYLDR